MAGKGQFVCGAKGCDAKDGLCSYEVNFAYEEAGQRKQVWPTELPQEQACSCWGASGQSVRVLPLLQHTRIALA